jgi:hypothetical protein
MVERRLDRRMPELFLGLVGLALATVSVGPAFASPTHRAPSANRALTATGSDPIRIGTKVVAMSRSSQDAARTMRQLVDDLERSLGRGASAARSMMGTVRSYLARAAVPQRRMRMSDGSVTPNSIEIARRDSVAGSYWGIGNATNWVSDGAAAVIAMPETKQ